MAFDMQKHLIKVQGGREYLPVAARLVWFREEHKDWGIETDVLELNHERQFAVFRARIYNADGRLMATGTKKEDAKGFGDYLEKAETGSVGRALALCGYGTQFTPELDEGADRQHTPPPRREERSAPAQAPAQPAQAAQAYQENGAAARAKPLDEKVFYDPREEVAPAEARVRAMKMFGQMDAKIKTEWLDYLKRTYDAPALGRVSEDAICEVYSNMAAADGAAARP